MAGCRINHGTRQLPFDDLSLNCELFLTYIINTYRIDQPPLSKAYRCPLFLFIL